jgi:hypothetical protein
MTLALDHSPAIAAPSRVSRLVSALGERLAAFRRYWFEEEVYCNDPQPELSNREWADLPTFHPTLQDE